MTADARHADKMPSSRRAAILEHLELLFVDLRGHLRARRVRSRKRADEKDSQCRSCWDPEKARCDANVWPRSITQTPGDDS